MSRHAARLAALERKYGPPSQARIDRVTHQLDRIEAAYGPAEGRRIVLELIADIRARRTRP